MSKVENPKSKQAAEGKPDIVAILTEHFMKLESGIERISKKLDKPKPIVAFEILKEPLDSTITDKVYEMGGEGAVFWSDGDLTQIFYRIDGISNSQRPAAMLPVNVEPFQKMFLTNKTAQAGKFVYIGIAQSRDFASVLSSFPSLPQFPAAVALSDTLANPTTSEIGANMLLWDSTGVQWIRALSAAPGANVGNVRILAAGLQLSAAGGWNRWAEQAQIGDGNTGANIAAIASSIFNASTYDRLRNNIDSSVFASASTAVGTTNSADIVLYNARGINLIVDITSVGAAGTVQLVVQVKDSVSGKYATVASFSIDTAISTNNKQVYPGVVAVVAVNGFESFSRVLGRIIRVQEVVAGNAVTLSVGRTDIV